MSQRVLEGFEERGSGSSAEGHEYSSQFRGEEPLGSANEEVLEDRGINFGQLPLPLS